MNFSSNSKSDCIALLEAFKVSFLCRAGDAAPWPPARAGHTPPSAESIMRPLMFHSNNELCWEQ